MAILMLGVVCLDMADASCDPVAGLGGPLAISSPQAGQPDACMPVCVPDCFCCSRLVVAGAVLLPAQPAPQQADPEAPLGHIPDGVRPVPYHPPLALA